MLSNQQVWAVNSAGYSASPWVSGRTGPAPPKAVDPPVFLQVSATSTVVEIHPPAQPNGIVSLYRVFSLDQNNRTLVKLIQHVLFLLFFTFPMFSWMLLDFTTNSLTFLNILFVLQLSEGTSLQQTLHGLRPYTQYWVGVEACTCYQVRKLNRLFLLWLGNICKKLITIIGDIYPITINVTINRWKFLLHVFDSKSLTLCSKIIPTKSTNFFYFNRLK